jgi:Uma2 family endonuclease
MTAIPRHDHLLTPEEYLDSEALAELKHEYLDGVVYAMAGAPKVHNRIAMNICIALGNRLRGGPCEVLGSDMKVRIRRANKTRFYYPDGQVVCGSLNDNAIYNDDPSFVFEVISESTRRIDDGEKKEAYLSLSSLGAYLLVETAAPMIVLHRDNAGITEHQVFKGLEAIVPLPFIGIELPLVEVYNRVTFSLQPVDPEEGR